MELLILILCEYTYQGLAQTLLDVKAAGIRIMPLLYSDGHLIGQEGDDEAAAVLGNILAGEDRRSAFMVTDNDEGVAMADRYGVGYVYVETDRAHGTGSGAVCIIQGFDEITADFLIKMYERYHHLPWMILETERLILREMTVDDVDRLYEIYEGPGITDFTEPLYKDRQEEIEYTKDYIRNMYEFCGYGLWLVIEKDGTKEGRIVGRAGITGREGYEEAELGYVIEASRQRRGYAAEACRAIVSYARDVLDMSGLNCFVYPGNEASVKLCKLIGFEYLEDVKISGKDMIRYHLDLKGDKNECCF